VAGGAPERDGAAVAEPQRRRPARIQRPVRFRRPPPKWPPSPRARDTIAEETWEAS
jgi:hypothetical protein